MMSSLGGQSVATAGAGTATSASAYSATALTGGQLPGGSLRSSDLYVSNVDPTCMTATATTATWSNCIITISDVDPVSGNTMDATVTIDGSLSSDQGVTTWNIAEAVAMTMTITGSGTVHLSSIVDLAGTVTVTPSAVPPTIAGNTSSRATITGTANGVRLDQAFVTTLDLNLGYETVPAFCITSGSLTLEQRWTQRPAGATALDYPDLGWQFDWAGCGVYQVKHGR